jgi:hypothetical protein
MATIPSRTALGNEDHAATTLVKPSQCEGAELLGPVLGLSKKHVFPEGFKGGALGLPS